MSVLRIEFVLCVALILTLLAEAPAEAYVDPGAASYTFQVLAGAVLGGLYLMRTYWSRLVTTVQSLLNRDVARNR